MRRALGPQTTFCFRSSTRSRHFTACRASSTQADEPLTFAPFDLKEEGPRGGYANVWVVLAGSPPSTSRARVVIRADPTLKRHMKELTALRHDGERWYLLVQSQAEVEEVLQRVQAVAQEQSLRTFGVAETRAAAALLPLVNPSVGAAEEGPQQPPPRDGLCMIAFASQRTSVTRAGVRLLRVAAAEVPGSTTGGGGGVGSPAVFCESADYRFFEEPGAASLADAAAAAAGAGGGDLPGGGSPAPCPDVAGAFFSWVASVARGRRVVLLGYNAATELRILVAAARRPGSSGSDAEGAAGGSSDSAAAGGCAAAAPSATGVPDVPSFDVVTLSEPWRDEPAFRGLFHKDFRDATFGTLFQQRPPPPPAKGSAAALLWEARVVAEISGHAIVRPFLAAAREPWRR